MEGDWTQGDAENGKTEYTDGEENVLFIDSDVSVSIADSSAVFDAIDPGGNEPVT